MGIVIQIHTEKDGRTYGLNEIREGIFKYRSLLVDLNKVKPTAEGLEAINNLTAAVSCLNGVENGRD